MYSQKYMTKERKPNHLVNERSPYLLQHAYNPVDWYPWSEEAFQKAREEDKPIFLSIGYSTCHWCHVMERESFEDEEVARLLNETFVCIKVDREERPDIDSVYMEVCQMMTGSGGWPTTLLLLPDKRPFFAATYIPKESRFNRPGLLQLIPQVQQLWLERREEVIQAAQDATSHLELLQTVSSEKQDLTEDLLHEGTSALVAGFDKEFGGFGNAPKFPIPHHLLYLLRYNHEFEHSEALHATLYTLRKMRTGGIFDHIGFGFHRYSTDRHWFLPHFEKMLYDNALLLRAYAEAYQVTGDMFFKTVAQQIVTYLERDLRDPAGAFYSSEDADSEGVEGKFYLWSEEELKNILGLELFAIAKEVFGIKAEGNFVEEATREKTGTNILHISKDMESLALTLKMTKSELEEAVNEVRAKLLKARSKRIRPSLDDKILTDWNGLAISALAYAGRALGDPHMIELAQSAADFLIKEMYKDGTLLHSYHSGEAKIRGFLSDYAFLSWGLIELFEASQVIRYLVTANQLATEMLEHFWDRENGGLFFNSNDSEELLVRKVSSYDGAIPSGNSVASLVLLKLAGLLEKMEYEDYAVELMHRFSSMMQKYPRGHTMMLASLAYFLSPDKQIVLVATNDNLYQDEMFQSLSQNYFPHSVLIYVSEDRKSELQKLIPYVGPLVPKGGTTAYICAGFTCSAPTTSIAEAKELAAAKKTQSN